MRRVLLVAISLCAAAITGGCGNPHERNFKQQIQLFKELNAILNMVVDEASLDRALPDLQELNHRFKLNAEERQKLGRAPEERVRKLRHKYGPELTEQSRLRGEHMKRFDAFKENKERFLKKLLDATKDIEPEG